MQIIFRSVQVMQWMTFVEIHVKWAVISTDCFGPEILSTWSFPRSHFKVPGGLSDLRAI